MKTMVERNDVLHRHRVQGQSYRQISTIITTNLSFDRWGEIIPDPVLVSAMIDRLTHKAMLINMTGQSYRIKETKRWIQQQKSNKNN